MNSAVWRSLLHRKPDTNKYDYGHMLIVGGSEAMTGAPILAARAALRTGAGLVTIASTAQTVDIIDRDIEEIMTTALPSWNDDQACFRAVEAFMKERHVSVLVVGSGLPAAADEVLRALISGLDTPMVVDAEAFTALSGRLTLLKAATKRNGHIVLTPHPGEYTRLLSGATEQYSADNERDSIRKFAQEYGVTLVLKRHHTLVANAHGDIYENDTGNPGLATAGSGDVLAGILAGLLAQKVEIFDAAPMAVWLHGAAGDIAEELKTQPGMVASDIIEAIPAVLKRLLP